MAELTDFFERQVLELVENETGIIVSASHEQFLHNYIYERLKKLKLNDTSAFFKLLKHDSREFSALISEAAINETYFFREEQQFDFLKENVFKKKAGQLLTFWSAACSTGEEAISLYTLAEQFQITPKIYATDIDSGAMASFKRGLYGSHSFRDDGKSFHNLLDNFKENAEDTFINVRSILSNISISQFNLVKDERLPFEEGSIDIIFLRNVFIYFDEKTRALILNKMSRALKEDGLLFLSVNEIPCVDPPSSLPLVKQHTKNVYYLKKVSLTEKQRLLKSENKLNLQRLNESLAWAENYKPPHSVNTFSNTQELRRRSISLEPYARETPKKEKIPIINVSEQNVVDICDNCIYYISKKDFSGAKESLEAYNFSPATMEYRWYLEGIIALEKKDKKSALEFFSKAALLNGRFWPALFQAGLLHKENKDSRNTKKFFLSCAKELDSYIQNGKTCYNFLMEQFSPDYFLQLCNTYIKQEEGR